MTAPVLKETQIIPMTAPVIREYLKDRGISMSFILPDNLNWQDLPIPNDKAIQLEQHELMNFFMVIL